MKKLLFFILLFSFGNISNAQHSVSLDPTFGTAGKVTTLVNPSGLLLSQDAALVQDDGKIVVATNHIDYPVIYRYLQNGDLDSTWGQNGSVTTPQHLGSNNKMTQVFQQDNGKIIVTGVKDSSGIQTSTMNYVFKYNIDGTLDQNFGSGGMLNVANPNFESLNVSLVVDSSIFLVNLKFFTDTFVVYSYNINDGLINSAFGNNGVKFLDYGTPFALQGISANNNKLLSVVTQGSTQRIYQHTSNFEIDSSFGTNGYISMSDGFPVNGSNVWRSSSCETPGISHFYSPYIQADNKILLGGISSDTCNIDGQVVVERYLPNGSKDLGFATNGILKFDFRGDTTELNYIKSINEFNNGYILLAGGVFPKYYPTTAASTVPTLIKEQFAMALFDASGNPIPSFGINGVYVERNFHVDDSVDILKNSFIQQDGKIVLLGYTPHYNLFDAHWNQASPPYGDKSINLSRYTIQGISEGGGVDLNQETKNDFTIYPNPTNSVLNIQSNKPIQKISVYNYLGELVIQENGQALNQINVEQLTKGIYVILMTAQSGSYFTGKFVKE